MTEMATQPQTKSRVRSRTIADDDRATIHIRVPVSRQDHAALEADAAKNGVTMAEEMRRRAGFAARNRGRRPNEDMAIADDTCEWKEAGKTKYLHDKQGKRLAVVSPTRHPKAGDRFQWGIFDKDGETRIDTGRTETEREAQQVAFLETRK